MTRRTSSTSSSPPRSFLSAFVLWRPDRNLVRPSRFSSCRRFFWMTLAWRIFVRHMSVSMLWALSSATWSLNLSSSRQSGCSSTLCAASFGMSFSPYCLWLTTRRIPASLLIPRYSLSDNSRAREALRQCLPEPLRDATFSSVLRDDAATKRCLAQLLINLSDHVSDGASAAM